MATIGLPSVQLGERTNSRGKAVRNRMLLAVPDEEYQLIRPHLEFGIFPTQLSLYEPHSTLKFVHFPNEGLISLIIKLKDGKCIGIGLLGNEGGAGMPGVFGLIRSPLREIVQVAGTGFRVRIEVLNRILQSTPALQIILSRYAAVLVMQVAQTAACNRLHNVEKRLARWLLIAQDRINSGVIPVTRDFLVTMLGTDRASAYIAVRMLKKLQIIETTRGAVTILKREELEMRACECYAIVRQYNGELS